MDNIAIIGWCFFVILCLVFACYLYVVNENGRIGGGGIFIDVKFLTGFLALVSVSFGVNIISTWYWLSLFSVCIAIFMLVGVSVVWRWNLKCN